MLKTQTKQMVSLIHWDNLIEQTYGKPYSFQQQNGCQNRGSHYCLTVPSVNNDFINDSIPEKVNGSQRGVSFKAWLARDPKQWNGEKTTEYCVKLFWERNFYPDIQTIANDLYEKGLLEAGEYLINIDW